MAESTTTTAAGGSRSSNRVKESSGGGGGKIRATIVGDSLVSSSNESGKPTTRRDVLIRQPSYCKILDDLKGTEASVANMKQEATEAGGAIEVSTSAEVAAAAAAVASGADGSQPVQTITINGQQYQIVSPSALASHTAVAEGTAIQTITVGGGGSAGSSASSPSSGVVQYAATSQNGQTVFIPGTMASPSSGPQIISVASGGGATAVAGGSGAGTIEEASRKREVRLLKNREAARECRNKKKEYIKCLENRVAILENQNKALIEELKSLKELYTGQKS